MLTFAQIKNQLEINVRYQVIRARGNPATLLMIIALIIAVPWVAFHYWQDMFPMRGTTIAKVVGYIVIPIILAVAGNHFAAEVIKIRRWKIVWRVIFAVLGMSGIFLVTVVEKAIDDQHDAG